MTCLKVRLEKRQTPFDRVPSHGPHPTDTKFKSFFSLSSSFFLAFDGSLFGRVSWGPRVMEVA